MIASQTHLNIYNFPTKHEYLSILIKQFKTSRYGLHETEMHAMLIIFVKKLYFLVYCHAKEIKKEKREEIQ